MSVGAVDPLVSVVIPTRNRRSVLPRTLATVLGQREIDLEVVVVDEASSDGTSEYLRGLGDGRLRVLRNEVPLGVAGARNAGLAEARGEWTAFVDDDDLWAPDKLACQVQAARRLPGAGWVAVGEVIVDEHLRVEAGTPPPTPDDAARLLVYNVVPGGGSGTMVRTDLAREVGGFDTELSVLADWELWLRLYLAAPFASVRRPLVGYVRHGTGMSNGGRIERELHHIDALYAGHRAERGVELDHLPLLLWQAQMHLRAQGRRAAVETYLRLARQHHDRRSWLRAVVAAVRPEALLSTWDRRARSYIPAGWAEEAESWLAPLRPC